MSAGGDGRAVRGGDHRGLEPFNAAALAGEPIAISEGDPRAEPVLKRVESLRPAGKLVDKGEAYVLTGVD